jgi:hypothetical protein
MFGLGDTAIALAMLGCIISTAVCVIYGAVNWNRGDDQNGGQSK